MYISTCLLPPSSVTSAWYDPSAAACWVLITRVLWSTAEVDAAGTGAGAPNGVAVEPAAEEVKSRSSSLSEKFMVAWRIRERFEVQVEWVAFSLCPVRLGCGRA